MTEEEEILEAERKQMRRVVAVQRIANGILKKWAWLLVPAFLALLAFFTFYVVWRAAYSPHRFNAVTRLLYTPRQVARIQNITDKQLLSVLDRRSLKRSVGERVEMPMSERECLVIDLEIEQERKPTNLFTLTSHAPTWTGAIKKVNSYAEVLIQEYVNYRKRDLDNWRDSIAQRRKGLQKQIAELESEEAIAKGKTGVASPVETLTMLNALISDQRRNLSMLSVQIANEEVRKAKLDAEVGTMGPMIVANAAAIRRKSQALEALDREIMRLRQSYTDINPKVVGKLDERKSLLDEYSRFLKEKGIDGVTPEDIDRVEKAAGELDAVTARIEVLAESQRSIEQEIKANEEKAGALVVVIPSLERLRVKRTDLERSMREFDEQMDDISYLEASMGNDLKQIELARGAGDENPLSLKNFVLATGGAAVCTLSLICWILFVEFLFGRVRGAGELSAYSDVTVLGSLPADGGLPPEDEADVLGVVALNYCNAPCSKDVVLVCRMPGAPVQRKFREALEWSLSMAGQRPFTLEIVSSAGFEAPEGSTTLVNAVRRGAFGWFPVVNRYSFAPAELQMLGADIATLRGDFDCVFIVMPDGMRRGGNFFDQLLGVCDSVVMVVGADRTPRASLSYVRKHVIEADKPMMGLVVGASARVVRREMDRRK